MSSQFGQAKPQPQINPYANIPGYRTDEPANSAWNRTILAYHSAGVPYSIEKTPSESSGKTPQESSLGNVLSQSSPSSNKSTNPEYENALLESFAKNPEAYKSTNFFTGLFERGVLTSSDYDKLNDIITSYNAKVTKENQQAQNEYNLGQGLYSLSQQQYLAKKQESLKEFKTSQAGFTGFLQQYEKQNATFQIIDKTGKIVGTTSGQRSYHDVLSAQKQFGEVKVQPILPGQEQAEKPFSIKEYLSGGITGFQKAVTTGKEANPIDYFIDVGKGIGSFFYQGGKQLAATAPIIGKELFDTITTGRTQYQIKGATPISGFAASFLQPSLGFTPYQQSQYQSNLKSIDSFIGSVKSQSKSQGLNVSGMLTPNEGSAGQAIGNVIGLGIGLVGFKDVVPLRGIKIGLASEDILTGKVTEVPYKGIGFGYGGPKTKPILGIGTGFKLIRGTPKPEQIVPNGSFLTSVGRGTNISSKASGFETSYLTSKTFLSDLEARGKIYPGTTKYLESQKSLFETGKTGTEERPKSVTGLKTQMFSLEATQAVLAKAGQRENPLYYLSLGGRTSAQGGSVALYASLEEPFKTAMGEPKDIDIHVSRIWGEGGAALRSANIFAKAASKAEKEPRQVYLAKEREVLALGEIEGKALEIPNPKSETIENVEGSTTPINESNLFGSKVSQKTYKAKTASGQKRSFYLGVKQFADQIRVSSSLQTVETLTEQARSGVGKLKPGAEKSIGKMAVALPPIFRMKDLAREVLKGEAYAKGFEEKGEFGKALTIRQNISTIKEYANKFYDVDWANVGSITEKPQTRSLYKDITSLGPIAKQNANRFTGSIGLVGNKTIPPSRITSYPMPQSNKPLRLGSSYAKSINSQVKINNQFSSITKSTSNNRSPKSNSINSAFKSINSPSSKPTSGMGSFSSLFSSPSNRPSSLPSKSPSSPPYSPFSSLPSSPPSRPPSSPPKSPSSSILSPPSRPPPSGKKKPPFGFTFGLNPENGPSNPVFGGGNKKSFIGNVPEFQFTGMFNRSETRYGKGTSVPRGYKITNKPASNAFTAFSKASGQGKKSSKQPKSLSNKFTRLI